MRLIVAGSRTITDHDLVFEHLDRITTKVEVEVVISGKARGPDMFGQEWANANDIPVIEMPADWDRYGKSAGYKRNTEMATQADALIAFYDGTSRGTKHMIDIARKMGLNVRIVRTDNA